MHQCWTKMKFCATFEGSYFHIQTWTLFTWREQNLLNASKIKNRTYVIKNMTLVFRDFVSNNEHFRMTFQQIWYLVWSGSNWPKSRFCSLHPESYNFQILLQIDYVFEKIHFHVKLFNYDDINARIHINVNIWHFW